MMLRESQVVEQIDGVSLRKLRSWVRHGWIVPERGDEGAMFTEIDVARARLIVELRVDLELDTTTIPMVLALMDQVYGLRRELRTLVEAVEEEGPETRARIAEFCRRRRGA